jgi:uncharacterized membrane protein
MSNIEPSVVVKTNFTLAHRAILDMATSGENVSVFWGSNDMIKETVDEHQMIEDFVDKCGYTRAEAIVATRNVLEV